MMVPLKVEYVPRVAELPTCQKTLAAFAPLMRTTWLLVPVVSALAIWKIKTAFALPWPLSVRTPLVPKPSVDVDLYRPGARVRPSRLPDTIVGTVRPAASLYAVVKSASAETAGPLSTYRVPPTIPPGGNPATALPGLSPAFPFTTVGPVFVTVEPASTVKLLAELRFTGNCAASRQAPSVPHTTTPQNLVKGSPFGITVLQTTADVKSFEAPGSCRSICNASTASGEFNSDVDLPFAAPSKELIRSGTRRPQLGYLSTRLPRLRRPQSPRVLACSSISW